MLIYLTWFFSHGAKFKRAWSQTAPPERVHRWRRRTRRSPEDLLRPPLIKTLADWTGRTGSVLVSASTGRTPPASPQTRRGAPPPPPGAPPPAASASRLPSDGKTKLPGVPVPPPLLFPPVPPDLSASVFSPSLCLTGRLSGVVTHAPAAAAAAFISAGQGLPHDTALTLQMERGPASPGTGGGGWGGGVLYN